MDNVVNINKAAEDILKNDMEKATTPQPTEIRFTSVEEMLIHYNWEFNQQQGAFTFDDPMTKPQGTIKRRWSLQKYCDTLWIVTLVDIDVISGELRNMLFPQMPLVMSATIEFIENLNREKEARQAAAATAMAEDKE